MAFRPVLTCLAFIALVPTAALCGPWPRAEGTAFLSHSVELSEDDYGPLYHGSSFLEYGLSRRLSLGGKVFQSTLGGLGGHVFIGYSLLNEGPHALSVELSVGQRGLSPWMGLGLAYGRGFTLAERNGWFTVEASVLHPDIEDDWYGGLTGPEAKLDLTAGLTMKNDWKTMLQVFLNANDNAETHWQIAPGIVAPITERYSIEFGARFDPDGKKQPALVMGVWQTF